jgi:flagellar basal body-associated protein FliL
MTRGRKVALVAVTLLLGALFAVAFVALPRWFQDSNDPAATVDPAAAPATPRIKARLFYVTEDGLQLVAVEREIPFGADTLAQGRRIVEAQLERPAPPLLTAIPEGTRLRAFFLGAAGEAYVDLSREVSAAHSGGTLDEILTVYSIVNALTTNLSAVRTVQILVDGREVDTLAGHVDLRRPLPRGASWVLEPPPGEFAPQK